MIILDLKVVESAEIYGLAALVFALSIGYYLVRKLPRFKLFSSVDDAETGGAETDTEKTKPSETKKPYPP